MKNNILILNGSMRKNGNTARLVQSFADGAVQNNNVEIVYVADYNVNPCIGCNSCFVRGVNDIGDIDGNSALKEAYDMGVSIE